MCVVWHTQGGTKGEGNTGLFLPAARGCIANTLSARHTSTETSPCKIPLTVCPCLMHMLQCRLGGPACFGTAPFTCRGRGEEGVRLIKRRALSYVHEKANGAWHSTTKTFESAIVACNAYKATPAKPRSHRVTSTLETATAQQELALEAKQTSYFSSIQHMLVKKHAKLSCAM